MRVQHCGTFEPAGHGCESAKVDQLLQRRFHCGQQNLWHTKTTRDVERLIPLACGDQRLAHASSSVFSRLIVRKCALLQRPRKEGVNLERVPCRLSEDTYPKSCLFDGS